MRKTWLTLSALLAFVIALGLFVWLKPPKAPAVAYALSTIKQSEARTLTVQRKGKAVAVLEKRGADWFMTEPINAPADSFQVMRLIAILDAKSATQYPITALAKYELDTPQSEIIINGERFALGAINNVTQEQYVAAQDQILPLPLNFGAAVPTDAQALLRRNVMAPAEVPQQFDLGTFTVTFDGKKWLTTPPTGDLSQDDFNRWVAQWREGSALRVETAGTEKITRNIVITLKSGSKLTLGVAQTEPELVLRRADLGVQFVFVAQMGAPMLAPPAVKK